MATNLTPFEAMWWREHLEAKRKHAADLALCANGLEWVALNEHAEELDRSLARLAATGEL